MRSKKCGSHVHSNRPGRLPRRVILQAALASVASFLGSTVAHADTLTWDPHGTTTVTDGTGTWDTSTLEWYNGTSVVAWNNTTNANTTALIGEGVGSTSTATTIGVTSAGIDAGGITFDKVYSIGSPAAGQVNNGTDGTITMSSGNITVDSGGSGAVINAPLAGSVTTLGSGNLYLRDNNVSLTSLSISGTGTVYAGGANGTTITSTGGDNLARAYLGSATSAITINSGATLSLQNGQSSYGGGTINLAGGTLALGNYASLSNNIDVTQSSFLNPQNNTLSGSFTGNGTLNWSPAANNRSIFAGSLANYTGTFELGSTTNAQIQLGTANASTVNFDLGTGNGELLNSYASSGTVQLGSLQGGSGTYLGGYANASGLTTTYAIGTESNSTFNGTIRNMWGNTTNGYHSGGNTVAINKVNSATTLTLSGYNSYKGTSTVEAGTLILDNNTYSTTVSEQAVTVSGANFSFSSGSPLAVGNVVTFGSSNSSGNTSSTAPDVPLGITPGAPYYVVGVSGSSFQVSQTPGGTAITPSTAGVDVIVSQSGALGATNSAVQLGDSGTLGSDTINLLLGGAYTMGRPISVNAYGAGTTIGASNTSGIAAYTGNITLATAVTLVAGVGGTTDFNTGSWTTGSHAITVGVAGTPGGVVQLDSAITDSGGITVQSGTLKLTNTFTGPANVYAGELAGTGKVTGLTTTNGGSVISPGGDGTVGTLNLAGGLNFGTSDTFNFDLGNSTTVGGTSNDLITTAALTFTDASTDSVAFNFTNGAPVTGQEYTLIEYSGALTGNPALLNSSVPGYEAEFSDTGPSNGDLEVQFVSIVPEPSSLGLLALGALGMLRRKRRQQGA